MAFTAWHMAAEGQKEANPQIQPRRSQPNWNIRRNIPRSHASSVRPCLRFDMSFFGAPPATESSRPHNTAQITSYLESVAREDALREAREAGQDPGYSVGAVGPLHIHRRTTGAETFVKLGGNGVSGRSPVGRAGLMHANREAAAISRRQQRREEYRRLKALVAEEQRHNARLAADLSQLKQRVHSALAAAAAATCSRAPSDAGGQRRSPSRGSHRGSGPDRHSQAWESPGTASSVRHALRSQGWRATTSRQRPPSSQLSPPDVRTAFDRGYQDFYDTHTINGRDGRVPPLSNTLSPYYDTRKDFTALARQEQAV
jgi:hypothetical protein